MDVLRLSSIHCWLAAICFAIWALPNLTLANELTDLTGVHRVLAKCDKNNDLPGNGPAYFAPCYEGFLYQSSDRIQLIQNGNKVCGRIESCAGYDCNKVFMGNVVGTIQNNTVTLYYDNGHIEEGAAEVMQFGLSPSGELLVKGSRKRAFVKTSNGVISQESKQLCEPDVRPPVRIRNYELDVLGTRPDMSNFSPEEKPHFSAPKPIKVLLRKSKNEVVVKDGLRKLGNMVPRTVWIHNTTDSTWSIAAYSATQSEANTNINCGEWLRSSEYKSANYAWAYASTSPGDEVPPNSVRYTRICSGDTLNLTRSLPECPKYQCLRSCRC